MRLAHQPLVLLLGNHYHALFALPGDALRTLVARAAKDFAEAGFRALYLP
jgi:hypothetical protein